MHKSRSGFTIVELLIVIVVIAILAAISIVAYAGIQTRANNTIVNSNLKNIVTAVENFNAIHGSYPSSGADYTVVRNDGLRLKGTLGNTLLYCVNTATNPETWMILAYAYPSGTSYRWASTGERNTNASVTFGSGLPTCETQMGASGTVSAAWAVTIAAVD